MLVAMSVSSLTQSRTSSVPSVCTWLETHISPAAVGNTSARFALTKFWLTRSHALSARVPLSAWCLTRSKTEKFMCWKFTASERNKVACGLVSYKILTPIQTLTVNTSKSSVPIAVVNKYRNVIYKNILNPVPSVPSRARTVASMLHMKKS